MAVKERKKRDWPLDDCNNLTRNRAVRNASHNINGYMSEYVNNYDAFIARLAVYKDAYNDRYKRRSRFNPNKPENYGDEEE